ncbi:MAG: hypothetical protein ABL933_18910, partial [Methyloglobulus sp.]
MQRMVRAASKSRHLMIPLGENTNPINSPWSESVRGDKADGYPDIGVLAVSLDPTLDRNKDGWADANNDRDFLDVNKNGIRDAGEPERIDEDTGNDDTNDGASGIKGIDDNGDGINDNGISVNDNDEDGTDDSIISVDDDTDGIQSEDWLDHQLFFLNGTTLMERLPNINAADGTAYTEYSIADNVSQLRVERVLGANGSTVLADITLTLSPSGGEPVSLNTRVAVGSGL